MPSNSDSQCYFVQLQIDSYLDGDLSTPQQEEFNSHVHQCEACAREFHYAQTVQDAILDLPQINCDEQVLEPIYRLADGHSITEKPPRPSFWSQLSDVITATPVFFRYAMPVAAVAIIAIAITPILTNQQQGIPMVAEQTEEYSPQDVRQALQDLNLAIDYLNQVSERTEVMIGDRFLVTPLQDSLNAS
ncbi:MAG TPA: hypothetical protein DCM64_02225, partial [Gammaproteobacteria bacterium]|nr:hypothetical protein [Gammaproteobacteria bacterium]